MNIEELKTHFNDVYFSESRHEKEILENLTKIIPKDFDVFIDIGASAGQYTYFASQLFKEKEFIAIEADPLRFSVLNENCHKWNNEGDNTITSKHLAIHEFDNKSVEFHITNSDISGSLFVNRHLKDKNIEIAQVKTISLAKLLDGFEDKKIFIKMDVEGAEFSAFRSGYIELNNYDITFFMEIHGWKDSNTGLYPWNLFQYFSKANLKPYFFKKHFIIKKSNYRISSIITNYFWSIVFFINYHIRYKFKG
jgi:FkbM family methyltransferase